MTKEKKRAIITAAVLILLAALACGPPSDGETPGATETPLAPPPGEGRCGDGVCDEAEQADPALCPQDCAEATPPPDERPCGDGVCDEREQMAPALCPQDCITSTVEPPPGGAGPAGGAGPTATPEVGGPPDEEPPGEEPPVCQTEEWWLVVEGCGDWTATEPSAHLCSTVEVCITAPVGETCHIEGEGQGYYDQGTCAYTSPSGACSWDVTCPDFPVSVSGDRITDTLRILVDASQMWEQYVVTCLGKTWSDAGPFMQTAYGSAIRNGGGYLCQIPAEDGAHVDVTGMDAVGGGQLTYDFDVDIYAGCP